MSVEQFRFETPSERQAEFFCARSRYILYGGARGGGKTWTIRRKSELNALGMPGINQIIIRRTFPELRENHILPMRAELMGIAEYKEQDKAFYFPNGSRIRFGYCQSESDVLQYQGQETDVLYIDEATQITEYQYKWLNAMVRGANGHIKRTVLAANPGGVGHAWVKRLFIDRDFRAGENPDDYLFIPARVYDNKALLANNPEYLATLEALPPALKEAWLYGNWDVFAGQRFPAFDRALHVIDPCEIPTHWRRYVALDYGMDMLAAYLIAVDEHDCAYVMRERYEGRDKAPGASGLIASEAAETVREMVGKDNVSLYLAPPDLWQTKPETGRSVADIFAQHGVVLTPVSNNRVLGWAAVDERLKVQEDEQGLPSARLRIFRGCANLIRTLPLLQYDEKKINDAATEPHEITHAPDALRYFCVYWTTAAKPVQEQGKRVKWTKSMYEDYRAASREEKDYLLSKWGRPTGGIEA